MSLTGTISILFTCILSLNAPAQDAPPTQAYQELFTSTAAEIIMKGTRDWGIPRSDIFPMMPYVERLEKSGLEADVPFLLSIAKEKDGDESTFALLILLRKGGNDAVEGLYAASLKNPNALILYFASPSDARAVAARMIGNKESALAVRYGASLLGTVGDANSLALLKNIEADVQDADGSARVRGAIRGIEARLLDTPEAQRDEWCKQQLLCMAARRIGRSAGGWRVRLVASCIHKAGYEFTIPFLRAKMKNSDGLAIALAAEQKATELIDDISIIAGRGGREGTMAMSSLGKIGTDLAFEAIGNQIKPGEIAHNRLVAAVLAAYPNETTAAILEKLTKDERYKESWPDFVQQLEKVRL